MKESKSDPASEEITENEGADIEEAFTQMEILYKSRCIQSPSGISNVVVKEIVDPKE